MGYLLGAEEGVIERNESCQASERMFAHAILQRPRSTSDSGRTAYAKRLLPSIGLTVTAECLTFCQTLTADTLFTRSELIIFNLLSANTQGMYGAQLVGNSGGSLTSKTVYVILGRMKGKGYVEGEKELKAPSGERGPKRRIWTLTGEGRRVFDAWKIMQGHLAGAMQ